MPDLEQSANRLALLLLAEPSQMRRVRKVLLNLCCLIRGPEGVAFEGCLQGLTERGTRLKSREQEEGLIVNPPIVDGVLEAVDGQMDPRAAHLGEAGSFDLLPLRDGVAHNLAWRSLLMDGQNQFVDGIAEVQKLEVRLQKQS